MELIFEWVEADRGCIMLLDADTKQLKPRVRRDRKAGATNENSSENINISRTILDYVLEQREGVLTSDAQDDQRFDAAQSIVRQGVREAICVPMQGRYDIVGVIYIDTLLPAARVVTGGSKKFSEDHLKLMVAIGHQAALAVEDTNYYSAMVQAERLAAVGQTIATLSHHIKNVLQGIRGGSYLIELGLNEHDEAIVRKGWDIVEKNQRRISSMVMDMLTFSKEREPDLAPCDLNDTVAEVIELMQARAAEKQVELSCDLTATPPTLILDPEGIHRAALNVVTNAIDACADNLAEGRPPGHVRVSTRYLLEGPVAQIIVADNGSGIAADDLQDIFSLFVSRKGSRGTGLGLPVSQKILKEHGGRIIAESELGRGSSFTLEFPAVQAEPPPDGGNSARETWHGEPGDDMAE
jgi:two-component system NtrC family sensor kinase